MAKIPIKFKRMAAAFDEVARWHRPCESSSGSEYWPESGTDLSDLVNSFLENGDGVVNVDQFDVDVSITELKDTGNGIDCDVNSVSDKDDGYEDEYTKRKEELKGLLVECGGNCGVKQKINDEIEVGLKLIGDYSSTDCSTSKCSIKRSLMARLRDNGFDAGICKSRWEKTGRIPSGSYEYIDVKMGQDRYIVEVFLTTELEIARPTAHYTSLLGMIPKILIIEKAKVLKNLMKLMSRAMRESLKHVTMSMPPWRRTAYLEARYLSPYKRTTNREPNENTAKGERAGPGEKRSMVGFEPDFFRVSSYSNCRGDDFVRKGAVRVPGLLAVALQGRG